MVDFESAEIAWHITLKEENMRFGESKKSGENSKDANWERHQKHSSKSHEADCVSWANNYKQVLIGSQSNFLPFYLLCFLDNRLGSSFHYIYCL